MTDEVKIQTLIVIISQFIKSSNQMRINYDACVEGFHSLERKIGPLPIFSLAEKLPYPHKTLRYKYMYKEFFNTLFQSFGVLPRMLDEDIWNQHAEVKNEQSKLDAHEGEHGFLWLILGKFFTRLAQFIFRGSEEDLLNRYCREWETLYNVFVIPVWRNLKRTKQVPRDILRPPTWEGRKTQIQFIKNYLENDKDTRILTSLLHFMNTALRNAIFHLNYYIDEKSKNVVYFDLRQKDVQPETISLQKLANQLFLLILTRLVLLVTMGQRLAVHLGINWDDLKQSVQNEN